MKMKKVRRKSSYHRDLGEKANFSHKKTALHESCQEKHSELLFLLLFRKKLLDNMSMKTEKAKRKATYHRDLIDWSEGEFSAQKTALHESCQETHFEL